jgi:hypothetical protein
MWAETFRSQVLRALAKRWSTVGRSARASGVPLAPVQYGTELPRYEEGCANEHAGSRAVHYVEKVGARTDELVLVSSNHALEPKEEVSLSGFPPFPDGDARAH